MEDNGGIVRALVHLQYIHNATAEAIVRFAYHGRNNAVITITTLWKQNGRLQRAPQVQRENGLFGLQGIPLQLGSKILQDFVDVEIMLNDPRLIRPCSCYSDSIKRSLRMARNPRETAPACQIFYYSPTASRPAINDGHDASVSQKYSVEDKRQSFNQCSGRLLNGEAMEICAPYIHMPGSS